MVLVLLALFLTERRWPDLVNRFEETMLAVLLSAITLISFSQVVMRYGFSSGWGGALEFTRVLFAWLILFGMSYAIKINSHLGVDAFIRMLPPRAFRAVAVFGAIAGILYASILLYSDWLQFFGANARGGALHYWSKMFQVGIGLDDLRYPGWAQEAFGLQDRVHRWLVYLILPVGLSLLGYRCIQAAIDIIQGKRTLIIAGHEAEDLVAENKNILQE